MCEVPSSGKAALLLSRAACQVVQELINLKLEGIATIKAEMVEKMDETVWKDWTDYGHFSMKTAPRPRLRTYSCDAESVGVGEFGKAVYVFPGRENLRPTIRNDVKGKTECTKKYYTSRPNMTSFLSLQCALRHPKIVGFSLLKEVESIYMDISTVISYLRLPPRTAWYDYACNLYDAALLRTPFLLR